MELRCKKEYYDSGECQGCLWPMFLIAAVTLSSWMFVIILFIDANTNWFGE